MNLKIHELAGKELLDAVHWYNQLQDDLGNRFQEMVSFQIGKIKKNPEWYPKENKKLFKAYIPKFPYKIRLLAVSSG